MSCELCQINPPEEKLLCEDCIPTECNICNGKLQSCEKGWECKNNHLLQLKDHLDAEINKLKFEADRETLFQHAGPRVEIIVPDPNSITGISESKEQLNKSSEELIAVHLTHNNPENIITEGFKPPSKTDRGSTRQSGSYEGTIRHDAIFGWPFDPNTNEHIDTYGHPVYFTVPKEECVISSYRFLDFYQYDPKINLDDYEERFCYNPAEVEEILRENDQPYSVSKLFF